MALPSRDVAAIRLGLMAARAAGLGPRAAVDATAIGWMESGLGMRGQFVLKGGRPSYNWGATTARDKTITSFGGGDLDEHGYPIVQRWAGPWPSLDQGLRYWLSFKTVQRSLPALERGDENEVARIFYQGGYYTSVPPKGWDEATQGAYPAEPRIAAYAAWIRQGRKIVLEAEQGEVLERVGVLGVAGGLAFAGWKAWRFYR